jgi:hypothetical protein
MLNKLYEIESQIIELLHHNILDGNIKTMLIDYHDPLVKRIWFQHEEYRVYLHKIFPTTNGIGMDALFHPHPWQSAIRILKGQYEMGIGHSVTDEIPSIDCKLILGKDSAYEMTEENGWHYVAPIGGPVFSLMVTGQLNKRKMPVEPKKEFQELKDWEKDDIINAVRSYYYEKRRS